MGALQSKPEWLDSHDDGIFVCTSCNYRTISADFLKTHNETYHIEIKENTYVLYMSCNKSIDGRNILNHSISAKWIDCTGGQAAYKDDDFEIFGEELISTARNNNIKLFCIYRMYDPGLGLDFPEWWVQGGINAGVFQSYSIPEDVKYIDTKENNSNNNETHSETDSEIDSETEEIDSEIDETNSEK